MQEENRRGEETKNDEISDNIHVGKNDKYLITKLRAYNISLDKIDSYIAKL